MAFPNTDLTLTQICDAYEVSRNMNALRGKIYYDANGTSFTVPSIGEVDMGQFRGKYKGLLELTLPGQEDSGSANGFLNSVSGTAGFRDVRYTIAGKTLTDIYITFYQTHSQGGSAVSSANNSESVYVVFDGIRQDKQMGRTQTTQITARSTFDIHVSSQASNNLGIQCSQGGTWQYTISETGLTYVGYIDR